MNTTTVTRKRMSRREAVATALGMDFQELSHYRYDAGTFYSPALYAVGNDYVLCGTHAEMQRYADKLSHPTTFTFAPHRDAFVQSRAQESGWTVWIGRADA